MARVAGQPSGVVRRGHLRKALRLGAVGLVTAGAHDGRVQFLGLHRSGIVGMFGESSVAGFASHNHMLAKLFLIHDVGMAGLASLVTGKRNWPGGDLADRVATVVSVLPKTMRYDSGPQHYECHQRYCHDGCQPNQVFDVLKQIRVPCATLLGALRPKLRNVL